MTNRGGTPTRTAPRGTAFMYDTILIWVPVLLSFALTYVGLYLMVRPSGHEHRKRAVMVLCFVCSAIALLTAIYIGSKNG